jgi:hypothetical protein
MGDPVLGLDGHNYEREALDQALARAARSPMTTEPLQPGQYVPNSPLRRDIQAWRVAQRVTIEPHLITVGATELGRGATGVVVEGTLRTGRRVEPVAIKRVMLDAPPAAAAALRREVRVLREAASHCPHIVQLLGTTVKDRQLCLVMKRYRGSLAQHIRDAPGGRLEPAITLMYGRQLCVALAELHGRAIICRDVKPELKGKKKKGKKKKEKKEKEIKIGKSVIFDSVSCFSPHI